VLVVKRISFFLEEGIDLAHRKRRDLPKKKMRGSKISEGEKKEPQKEGGKEI